MNNDIFAEITHSGGSRLVLPHGLFKFEHFKQISGCFERVSQLKKDLPIKSPSSYQDTCRVAVSLPVNN